MKNKRNLKVVSQSGYRYAPTPTITLKGKWLSEIGFQIGDYVSITCEDGRIVITPDTERAALAKAEQEFMDREMKDLQKRFEKEKERIHAQFVAENSVSYGEGGCLCLTQRSLQVWMTGISSSSIGIRMISRYDQRIRVIIGACIIRNIRCPGR